MEEKLSKQLRKLVLPITLQNLMSAAVSASDALMLGFVDQDSLAAVSLAVQVQFVLSLFHAALTIGATILAAQYWGKRDKAAVEQVLAISLRMSVFISLVFSFLAALFPAQLMNLFTGDKNLLGLGSPYLRLVSPSYLFQGISQIYLCIMKNSGRVLRSTLYGSTAMTLNFLLNGLLIFGLPGIPAMGIRGAALATTLARTAELILILLENRRKEQVRIRSKYLHKPSPELKKDFFRYTAPVMANELVWGCGFTMFSVIMGHLGSDAVAANAIANIVKNVIACVCLGIGSGSGILVGNVLGRGQLNEAKELGDKLCHIAIAAGAMSGAVILLLRPLILTFTHNLTPEATGYLEIMLLFCSYYMIGKSINSTVIAGIFCAGGDTKFGMICDAVTMWAIIIPVGAIAAFLLKLPVLVVYFLLNLDEIIKLPAVYRHYKKYHWVKDLTGGTLHEPD